MFGRHSQDSLSLKKHIEKAHEGGYESLVDFDKVPMDIQKALIQLSERRVRLDSATVREVDSQVKKTVQNGEGRFPGKIYYRLRFTTHGENSKSYNLVVVVQEGGEILSQYDEVAQ